MTLSSPESQGGEEDVSEGEMIPDGDASNSKGVGVEYVDAVDNKESEPESQTLAVGGPEGSSSVVDNETVVSLGVQEKDPLSQGVEQVAPCVEKTPEPSKYLFSENGAC